MDDLRTSKLGILAGGGQAPRQIIRSCLEAGRPFFLLCLEGQAEASLAEEGPHVWLSLGSAGALREICQKEKIEEVVMIGRVRRPSIAEIKPDFLGMKFLAKIGLGALGDDGVLRAVARALEEVCGVRVVGAHEVLPDLLASEGVLTFAKPDKKTQEDIARGFEILEKIGPLDIGQAVVIQHGIVLGVEAIEGTDALIVRAGDLKRRGGGGVLVKSAKPAQDARFDLPSIGPDTIESLARAGFAGVAVQAGHSLLIERERLIEESNAKGLFVVGVKREPSHE